MHKLILVCFGGLVWASVFAQDETPCTSVDLEKMHLCKRQVKEGEVKTQIRQRMDEIVTNCMGTNENFATCFAKRQAIGDCRRIARDDATVLTEKSKMAPSVDQCFIDNPQTSDDEWLERLIARRGGLPIDDGVDGDEEDGLSARRNQMMARFMRFLQRFQSGGRGLQGHHGSGPARDRLHHGPGFGGRGFRRGGGFDPECQPTEEQRHCIDEGRTRVDENGVSVDDLKQQLHEQMRACKDGLPSSCRARSPELRQCLCIARQSFDAAKQRAFTACLPPEITLPERPERNCDEIGRGPRGGPGRRGRRGPPGGF